jgi:hypothetical protein
MTKLGICDIPGTWVEFSGRFSSPGGLSILCASRSGKFQVSRTGEGKKVDNNIKNTLLLDAVGPKLF